MGQFRKAAGRLRRAASSPGKILAALGLNPGYEREKISGTARQMPDPIILHLRELIEAGDYSAFETAWNAALISNEIDVQQAQLLILRAEADLARGKHEQVRLAAERLIVEFNNAQGYYFQARSHFLCAEYGHCISALQSCLFALPNHVDSSYLLSSTAALAGDRELAWRSLEYTARKSKRARTWLLMANLVETQGEFSRLYDNWRQARTGSMVGAHDLNITEYLALGALRARNYPLARQIWRNTLLGLISNPHKIKPRKPKEVNYSGRRAEATLADLNSIFRAANIQMFLISGTLLGCVREGRLLGHDKDIDVGIWDGVPIDRIEDVVRTSGLFVTLASRSKEILRLRHANGVAVDVFYHFREERDYWHAGVKMKWHNSPFELIETDFLQTKHLIPKNFDTYLRENYGDWRVPKIDFDSAFDTPNGEVTNRDEFVVYCFKMLASKLGQEEGREKVNVYLERITKLGEQAFVKEFLARSQL